MEYRIARIPKGRGRFREICIASRESNQQLRSLLPELEDILAREDSTHANYAFEKRKNCVLNAFRHVGYRHTLSLDLEDFFDSVTPAHVAGVIPAHIINQCFVEGSPKQGLPTSPLIATIAFLPCDREIMGALAAEGIECIYTRYADDLTFSFNLRSNAARIVQIVGNVVGESGFRINQKKTTLQDARNGRVIINGLAVDANGICATRATKKRLRAAAHQGNKSSLNGLLEWAKCKFPSKPASTPTARAAGRDARGPGRRSPIKKFELVLFDLDGCLLRTTDLEDFRGNRNVGVTTDARLQLWLARAGGEERVVIPQATIDSIRKAHRNVRLGVFTTSPRFYAKSLLDFYYPATSWDVVVAFEDVAATKPHADGIRLACSRAGIDDAERVILIGDTWKDIASAYRAGCWCVLFKRSWPAKRMWSGDQYRALNYLPDAIAEEPHDLEQILADPVSFLPTLEQLTFCNGITRSGSARRVDVINHFNNTEGHGQFVRVLALGRLFPDNKEIAQRRRWHEITRQIHALKNAIEFPRAWVLAIRGAIRREIGDRWFFEDTQLVVTVIPSKSGRTARLERFLAQLAQNHEADPIHPDAEIEFIPDVLSYKPGARSHHGALLSAQERFENVRDNLFVNRPNEVGRQHFLVIDDVVTSGATMYYAAKYLRAAGAAKVACVALTQTVRL